MSVKATIINVGGTAAFPVTPQFSHTQLGTIAVANLDSTATVEISFDGTNVHGTLVPSTPAAAIAYNSIYNKLWLRTSAGTANVQIILETARP